MAKIIFHRFFPTEEPGRDSCNNLLHCDNVGCVYSLVPRPSRAHARKELVVHVFITLFVHMRHDFGISAIEFWPAWLSPRMGLSSPDHSPLKTRTRVLAIFSSCRFSSYNTASGRFYQPGETFMTHLTYSGLCCFFIYFFFLSTERIDERYIKAPIAASKCRPTTSEVAWVFSGR